MTHRTSNARLDLRLSAEDRVRIDFAASLGGFTGRGAASLDFSTLPDEDRKRLPRYPGPAVRIGRLTVLIAHRKAGLGELPLQNAIKRSLHVRLSLVVYAVVAEAKDAIAEKFCYRYGFRLSNAHTRQIYPPLGKC